MLRNYLPTTNVSGLYWEKVKTVFWAGFDDYDYASPFIWIGHLATLPISLSVIPPLMTVSDLLSRKPLSDNNMKDLILNLKQLKGKQFAEVVDKVIETPANNDYELTVQLKNKLKTVKHSTASILNKLEVNECARVKNTTQEKLEAEAVQRLFPGQSTISLHLNYDLTSKDLEAIAQTVKANSKPIKHQKRADQENAIITYLSDATNAGSDAVHVINDAVTSRRTLK